MILMSQKALTLIATLVLFLGVNAAAIAGEDPESSFISQTEKLEDIVYHDPVRGEQALLAMGEDAKRFSQESYLKYIALLTEALFYNGKYEESARLIEDTINTYTGDEFTQYYFDGLSAYAHIVSAVRGRDMLSEKEMLYDIARHLNDNESIAIAAEGLGFYHLQKGQLVSAYNYIAEMSDVAEQVEDNDLRANNKFMMGHVLSEMGLHDEALDYLYLALDHYKAVNDNYSQSIAYELVGLILARKGDDDEAYKSYASSIEQAERGGFPHLKGMSVISQAHIHYKRGEHEEGLALIESLEAEIEGDNYSTDSTIKYTTKAELLIAFGRLNEAKVLIEKKEAFMTQDGAARVLVDDMELARTKAMYEEAIGHHKQAAESYWRYIDMSVTFLKRRAEVYMTEIAMQYEADKKEAQRIDLLHEKEKTELVLSYSEKERFRQIIFATLSILLCLGLLAFLYLQVRSRRRLAYLASYDSLTDALNRRAIMLLGDKIKTHQRKDDYSIILLDVDNFKGINDRYGHDIGDSVLRAFAKICGEVVRIEDNFGRFGGEEFVAILPATNKVDAIMVANRMKEVITHFNWSRAGVADPVTASIGVATAPKSVTQSFSTTLNQADAAMYHVKNNGRNNVCHFSDMAVEKSS